MAQGNLATDVRNKLAANLQVLRRYDNQIEALIDTTSHAVLYQFQDATQTWAEKGVRGTLFIYKRATAPYYGFMIMNRLGVDNYTEELSAEMSFLPSGEIVIYSSKSMGCAMGIWIYAEEDRTRILEQLSLCCKSKGGEQGPQPLYPKNAHEESEFKRQYPRSRSNSRKDGGVDNLSAVINHTRQQQQQKQQQQRSVSNAAPVVDAEGVSDLVKKLRAIGIEPTANADKQPSTGGASGNAQPRATAVPTVKLTSPQHSNEQAAQLGNGQTANGNGVVAGAFQAVTMQQPVSPALHPAPSPFPPSTIVTPLPAQGMPGPPGAAAYGQAWHAHMSSPPMSSPPMMRSVHASPAPATYGMGLPVAAAAAAGAAPSPAPAYAMGIPGMVVPAGMLTVGAAGPSVAQNLAEQLVSLVRQRMNTLHTGSTSADAAAVAQAQREYCREWLIRVIQMDDELVDAFVRRFPPPAPPPPQ
ncbi:hypothetical protein EV175_003303 [Coemansia sp. RSA 1933]|nr:hypothetical protein EV175_003303 [Coemansia sp. RSA 1933]